MFILVLIFIILFCVSVAALALSSSQQHTLLKKGWGHLSNETKDALQNWGNCCGFEDANVTGPLGHPTCAKVSGHMQRCLCFCLCNSSECVSKDGAALNLSFNKHFHKQGHL